VIDAQAVLGFVKCPLRDAVCLGLVDDFDSVKGDAFAQFSLEEPDGAFDPSYHRRICVVDLLFP